MCDRLVLDSSERDDRHGALLDAHMTADALILLEHQLKHGETGAPRSWTSRPDRRDGSVNKRHSANAAQIERQTACAAFAEWRAKRGTGDPGALMKPTSESSRQEVLAGLVEPVTFHNAENGFCVLRAKARGHRDLVTVVGHAAIISAGEWITASGEWINDRAHGQQFRARFLKTSAPSSIDGIEKYLG